MKSSLVFSLFLFILVFETPRFSNCQWQPEVRLTNDNHESKTSFNNAKCIVSNNNVVHVVWESGTSGDYDIFYKRSNDEGMTWGSNILITNDPGNDGAVDPCIAVSGTYVYVAWTDLRYRPNWEIYFKRSTDGGLTWGSNLRMTNGSLLSRNPSIASSDSTVHLVWSENSNAFYRRSTDRGINWEFGIQLSTTVLTTGFPSISVSGTFVHAVWTEIDEIFYKRSINSGVSWDSAKRLTYDAANSWCPSISVSGQETGVVWVDLRDGNYEIYYKQSSTGGDTWGPDTRLTNDFYASYYPSVFVSGSIVHVAWYEVYYDYKLYYKKSINGGLDWGMNVPLTNVNSELSNPSLSASDSVVHAVWFDGRNPSTEIYYRRDLTGGSLFSINLTAIMEGFYNSVSNTLIPDTATVYLRNNAAPYSILDSSVSVLNTSGAGDFNFSGINNGTGYYAVIKHRNTIETWSSAAVIFLNGTLTYDFTAAATRAYGNNQKQVDTSPVRFAAFSGDVDQNGYIDLTDVITINNDASNYAAGYIKTDLTGNNITDLTDVIIAYNNSTNFVSVKKP